MCAAAGSVLQIWDATQHVNTVCVCVLCRFSSTACAAPTHAGRSTALLLSFEYCIRSSLTPYAMCTCTSRARDDHHDTVFVNTCCTCQQQDNSSCLVVLAGARQVARVTPERTLMLSTSSNSQPYSWSGCWSVRQLSVRSPSQYLTRHAAMATSSR